MQGGTNAHLKANLVLIERHFMYIARQPIFSRDMKVYGYELLYRAERDSKRFNMSDNLVATATVLAGVFENGLDAITEGKRAFVNFDEQMLFSDIPYIVTPDKLIIENLETVRATDSVLERVNKLKEDGYKIALDDFDQNYDTYALVECANIIKFDLLATPLSQIEGSVKKALRDGKIILAEKVENVDEFNKAKEMGFHLFQGFFFQKPYIVGKSATKISSVSQYTRILSELSKEEVSFQALAEIFESNIDLAYKVIKMAGKKNFSGDIYSIKRALAYIGVADLKLWVSVLMMRDIGNNKSPELMRLSLVRAKFAELLCKTKVVYTRPLESFMLGLFSTIDALMDEDMKELMIDMPFSDELKNGLLRKSGELKRLFDFMVAYEQGELNGEEVELKIKEKDIEVVYDCYLNALAWGNSTYRQMGTMS